MRYKNASIVVVGDLVYPEALQLRGPATELGLKLLHHGHLLENAGGQLNGFVGLESG